MRTEGQVVRTFNKNETVLNLDGIFHGLYLLKVATIEGVGVNKVVVR
ncbi:MAG: hypothetical protein JW894_03745 [Bacteroidales bacterium]|nr:hypothetical protein [Bacteroidales bacterium]